MKSKKENMIIIRIGGGLGNQLFQYALGRNLSLTKNIPLRLDLSWFKTNLDREYKLKYFNTREIIATDSELKKIKRYQKINSGRYFLHNLLFSNESIYIEEKQFHFNSKVLDIKDIAYLIGYWQTEKYFENIKDIIRKDFTLKNEPSGFYKNDEQEIREKNSVSLHIRRGDYITNGIANANMGVCSLEYYKKAVNIIKDSVNNPTFFIFSDDIDWATENLQIDSPAVFVSDKKLKDYEELILMSKCKHNIIANSSFSWWGAWLNNSPDKIVIAPKKWFNDTKRNSKDIIPNNWIKV
ncbi:MAG TPA: alpha-1,2-fucosyltransferase [Ignavibacteria bacterium]|nr:alpha-1,2-fucosyltransferase [Ignavibacteria bacterium]